MSRTRCYPSLSPTPQETGQSMVGTLIVGLFVLVPVFLMVPLLGKYIDLQATALQAARNAAFERTIFSAGGSRNGTTVAAKSNATLTSQIQSRFFSSLDQGIRSGQPHAYSTRSLWSGTAGNALLPSYQDVTVSLQEQSSPDKPDHALQDSLDGLSLITAGGPASALNFQGLYTAKVQIKPRAVDYPFLHRLKLDFHARDALLADGWDASSSADVKKQVQHSLPLLLHPLRIALDLGKPAVEDLDGLHLQKVLSDNPQEVPADHLKAYQP